MLIYSPVLCFLGNIKTSSTTSVDYIPIVSMLNFKPKNVPTSSVNISTNNDTTKKKRKEHTHNFRFEFSAHTGSNFVGSALLFGFCLDIDANYCSFQRRGRIASTQNYESNTAVLDMWHPIFLFLFCSTTIDHYDRRRDKKTHKNGEREVFSNWFAIVLDSCHFNGFYRFANVQHLHRQMHLIFSHYSNWFDFLGSQLILDKFLWLTIQYNVQCESIVASWNHLKLLINLSCMCILGQSDYLHTKVKVRSSTVKWFHNQSVNFSRVRCWKWLKPWKHTHKNGPKFNGEIILGNGWIFVNNSW